MKSTIEELEKALEWCNKMFEYSHKQCESAGISLSSEITRRENVILNSLQQAIDLAKGDSVVVPKEPTEKIFDSMHYIIIKDPEGYDAGQMKWYSEIYNSIIQATPKEQENGNV